MSVQGQTLLEVFNHSGYLWSIFTKGISGLILAKLKIVMLWDSVMQLSHRENIACI